MIGRASVTLPVRPLLPPAFFGVRGGAASWSFDLVAYQLTKRDDLVSQLPENTSLSIRTVGEGLSRRTAEQNAAGIAYRQATGS